MQPNLSEHKLCHRVWHLLHDRLFALARAQLRASAARHTLPLGCASLDFVPNRRAFYGEMRTRHSAGVRVLHGRHHALVVEWMDFSVAYKKHQLSVWAHTLMAEMAASTAAIVRFTLLRWPIVSTMSSMEPSSSRTADTPPHADACFECTAPTASLQLMSARRLSPRFMCSMQMLFHEASESSAA